MKAKSDARPWNHTCKDNCAAHLRILQPSGAHGQQWLLTWWHHQHGDGTYIRDVQARSGTQRPRRLDSPTEHISWIAKAAGLSYSNVGYSKSIPNINYSKGFERSKNGWTSYRYQNCSPLRWHPTWRPHSQARPAEASAKAHGDDPKLRTLDLTTTAIDTNRRPPKTWMSKWHANMYKCICTSMCHQCYMCTGCICVHVHISSDSACRINPQSLAGYRLPHRGRMVSAVELDWHGVSINGQIVVCVMEISPVGKVQGTLSN